MVHMKPRHYRNVHLFLITSLVLSLLTGLVSASHPALAAPSADSTVFLPIVASGSTDRVSEAPSQEAEASAMPSAAEITKYLVIGMGDMSHIDNAFQMSNTEIGADKNILSAGEAVGFGNGSSFPNLRDVFNTRWNLSTNPDSLNNADPVFQGVDWSGNVALTSDNSSFDSANSLVYADLGIRTASSRSQFDSVDSQSRYFAPGNSTSPVALRSAGTSNNNNLAPILTELGVWKSFINGLSGEVTITKAQIESIFVNNSASNGNGGLRQSYADALDTNNDGVILVNVNTSGIDFSVNNTDWVINGTGNKLIIFRINNGANMLMSNASITLGTGGIARTGVIFFHASEPGQSSDSVFNGNNVVLDGGAFWDMNDVGESGSGSDGHNIVINNGQGCWQFISQKVNFQNTRWNKCAPSVAKGSIGDRVWDDLDRDGVQDAGEPGVSGATVQLKDCANNILRTTTTNAAGNYSFGGLDAGCYRIGVVLPANRQFSPQDQGGNDTTDSDINPTNSMTGDVNLAQGENNPTLDAGLVDPTASLGDRVWDDTNRNGIQDNGEVGVPNVVVILLSGCTGNTVVGTTTTNANGNYGFANLSAGQYRVQMSNLPAGFVFSPQNQGANDAVDSDVNTATGISDCITLATGQNDPNWDAGINIPATPTPTPTPAPLASLGDFVWNDLDRDGVQDAGEVGIAGVTVRLLDCNGNQFAITTTNGNGNYQFVNLNAGCYLVEFVAAGGFVISPQDQGGNDATDSDASPVNGRTGLINLAAGQNNPTIDAGVNQPATPTPTPTSAPLASLGDFVWNDLDRDGVQDAGEPGIVGVTVRLLDCNGNQLATTTTNGSGNYQFANLNAGCYLVEFVAPAGFVISPQDQGGNDTTDSDANPANGRTGQINLAAGQNNPTIDAGVNQPATPTPTPTRPPGIACLGNRVFLDQNGNGIQNSAEPRVSGVTVYLWVDDDGNGTPDRQVASTVTVTDGFYQFCGLTPGVRYVVQFVPPTGFRLTVKDAGTSDAIDSDPNPNTGFTDVVVLTAGQTNNDIDAGLVVAPTPTNTPVAPTPTPTNTPVAPTPTPTNTPGNNTGIIGDFVFNDLNQNGVQDAGETGVDAVLVQLLDCNNIVLKSTVTVGGGAYKFDGLAAGCYRVRIGLPAGFAVSPQNVGNDTTDSDISSVTRTSDNVNLAAGENNPTVDAGIYRLVTPTPTPTPAGGTSSVGNFVFNDTNQNGVQDPGEPGIANITVRLLDCNNSVLASKQSAFDGFYRFDDLAAGCYKVQFVRPAGYVFSPVNVGSDILDSDAALSTGITDSTTLAVGEGDNSLDAGLYANVNTGTILGTSWFDQDNNGIRTPDEGPFTNVTVNLLQGCVGNTILRTVQTDGNGDYNFSALPAGQYRIEAIGVPGYPFSPKDAGTDETIDSDIDNVTGISDCITVSAGSVSDIDIGVDPILAAGLLVVEQENLANKSVVFLPFVGR